MSVFICLYIHTYMSCDVTSSSQISSGTVMTSFATETRRWQPFPLLPERIMGRRTSRPSPAVCPECPSSVRRTCPRWWTTCVTLCWQLVLNPCTARDAWRGCSRSCSAAVPPPRSTPSSHSSPDTATWNRQDSAGAEAHGKCSQTSS